MTPIKQKTQQKWKDLKAIFTIHTLQLLIKISIM